MIFDSTIWIDYLKGVKSKYTDLLDRNLEVYAQVDVHLCPPIFQEVLQGIRITDNYEFIKELLITS